MFQGKTLFYTIIKSPWVVVVVTSAATAVQHLKSASTSWQCSILLNALHGRGGDETVFRANSNFRVALIKLNLAIPQMKTH